MTVGELVYKQALDAGYDPHLADKLISPVSKVLEAHQKIVDRMQEPAKKLTAVAEHIQSQFDIASKIKIPEITTSSIFPDSYYDEDGEPLYLSALQKPIQEVRIVNPEDIASVPTKPTSDVVVASYTLPTNATWESLDIKFLDGHIVKVSYPNMKSEKFDYKEMGFANGKTRNPNLKWMLLKAMADNGGALINTKWDRKFGRNIKYELNEGLKKFFGMKEPPIPHYTKKDGYHTKFTLRGDR